MDFSETESPSEDENDLLYLDNNAGQEKDSCLCRLFCVKLHVRRIYLILNVVMVPRLVFTVIFCPLHFFHFLPLKALHIYAYWYISLQKLLLVLGAHFPFSALHSLKYSVTFSIASCLLDILCMSHGLVVILYPNNMISRWTLSILTEILGLQSLSKSPDLAKVYRTTGSIILLVGFLLLCLDAVFLVITMRMIVYTKQK